MQTLTEKLESVLGVKKAPSAHEKELFPKTQDFVRFIRWIPGLRMVAVSNSLAMYATHKHSDIDLFIITAPRRLWLVRTVVLLTAGLLWVRTKPGNEAGRFCFPFFMTEKNLSLKEIAIENDLYLAYWIRTLKPIYNQSYVYGRFMEVNRAFCETTLQSRTSEEEWTNLLRENRTFLIPVRRHEYLRKLWVFLSPILSLKNAILGYVSKKLITQKIPAGESEGIIVNDDMAKLHWNDRRREIRERVMDANG